MAKSIQTKLLCQGLMWLGLLQLCGCTLEPGTVFTGDDSEAGSGMEAPSTTADLTSSTAAMTTSNTAEPDSMMETDSDTVESTTSTTDPTTSDTDAITDSDTESSGLYITPFCGDGHIDPLEECDNPGHSGCTSDCKLAMRVFVTKDAYQGNLVAEEDFSSFPEHPNSGLEAIDDYCKLDPFPADLGTTATGGEAKYKAYIHHPGADAPATRFNALGNPEGEENPYVRVCVEENGSDVTTIANNWVAFRSTTHLSPIACHEVVNACVWTNVGNHGEGAGSAHCGLWTNNTTSSIIDFFSEKLEIITPLEFITNGSVGSPSEAEQGWTKMMDPLGCDSKCHLYCVEQYPTEDPNG